LHGRFVPRKISHPHFKNIGLQTALMFLKQKKNGSFIFRPSSKGIDYLNITWKFYQKYYVHLEIKEMYKSKNK